MEERHTTTVIQCYLDELADGAPGDDIIRPLMDRSVQRLHQLCVTLLYRNYPRLTRPPVNLRSDEMLSALVQRLLQALRVARPKTVREFFALAGQHTRWELNGLARAIDQGAQNVELVDGLIPASPNSDSCLSENGRRMLEAIDELPADEREAFDLVRIQGLTYVEAAELLKVAPKTVRRRLDRGLVLLTAQLNDLGPEGLSSKPC